MLHLKISNKLLLLSMVVISLIIMTSCKEMKNVDPVNKNNDVVATDPEDETINPTIPDSDPIIVPDDNISEIDTTSPLEVGEIVFKDEGILENCDGVTIIGSLVYILSSGTFNLRGIHSDTQIIVEVTSEDKVTLVMNGVNLTNPEGAVIYCKNADKLLIELADDTTNVLRDGSNYTSSDYNACITSKDDLTIKGNGTLKVYGNYNNGIDSSNDLKITGGNIYVEAMNNGLKGNDSVQIKNATISIVAKDDGIKSDNETETDKGYITIESGTFNIVAYADGFDSTTDVTITAGSFTIESGKDHTYLSDEDSAKAIKATNTLCINGGDFTINAADDALHANGTVIINGGNFSIYTKDDGIHADELVTINGGDINISYSYEGIEGCDINIKGGTIHLLATDDGINIAGGQDSLTPSFGWGRPGNPNTSTGGTLTIDGGFIYINATGDGIDVNGSVVMNDGVCIVNGPTNSANGALDYDNSFVVKGGTLIAMGSSGMAQNISNTSTQCGVLIRFSNNLAANAYICLKDAQGEVVACVKTVKTTQSIIISTPSLSKNNSYSLYTGGTYTNGSTQDGYCINGEYSGGVLFKTFTPNTNAYSVGSSRW